MERFIFFIVALVSSFEISYFITESRGWGQDYFLQYGLLSKYIQIESWVVLLISMAILYGLANYFAPILTAARKKAIEEIEDNEAK